MLSTSGGLYRSLAVGPKETWEERCLKAMRECDEWIASVVSDFITDPSLPDSALLVWTPIEASSYAHPDGGCRLMIEYRLLMADISRDIYSMSIVEHLAHARARGYSFTLCKGIARTQMANNLVCCVRDAAIAEVDAIEESSITADVRGLLRGIMEAEDAAYAALPSSLPAVAMMDTGYTTTTGRPDAESLAQRVVDAPALAQAFVFVKLYEGLGLRYDAAKAALRKAKWE